MIFGLPTDPLLVILVLVFLFLTLLVVSLIFVNSYTFFGKWFSFIQQERNKDVEKIKNSAYKKAEDIVDGAKEASLKIIEEANAKAQKTINSAKEISDGSKNDIKRHLDEVSLKHIELLENTSKELNSFYKQAIEYQKGKSITTLQELSHTIEGELASEVDEFKEVLHKETVDSQRMVEQKLQDAYKEIGSEIDMYRNEKIRLVETNIFRILAEVSKEVFGKSISLEDKQDLVFRALEAAKRKEDFKSGDNS